MAAAVVRKLVSMKIDLMVCGGFGKVFFSFGLGIASNARACEPAMLFADFPIFVCFVFYFAASRQAFVSTFTRAPPDLIDECWALCFSYVSVLFFNKPTVGFCNGRILCRKNVKQCPANIQRSGRMQQAIFQRTVLHAGVVIFAYCSLVLSYGALIFLF